MGLGQASFRATCRSRSNGAFHYAGIKFVPLSRSSIASVRREAKPDTANEKTEILRFRSDADTLAALKDLCQQSGRSLSDVLRDSLLRELAHREGGSRGAANESRVFGRAASCADSRDRAADADVLSTLLIGCRPRSGAWEAPEQLQRKHREVSRLLEALLRTLDPSIRSAPQAAVGDAFLEKKLREASGDSSASAKAVNGYAGT
jgi:hypothetical protein